MVSSATSKIKRTLRKSELQDHSKFVTVIGTQLQPATAVKESKTDNTAAFNPNYKRYQLALQQVEHECDGLTDRERQKRKLEAVLEYLLLDANYEPSWYSNMIASLKYDEFCEILAKFPDRDMLKISQKKRKEIFSGSLKIFGICSVKLELNSSRDDPSSIWNENILQFICRNDIQEAADIILDEDLIYKVAAESLLTNGLNSLGPEISKEVISYVKIVCCVMRLCLAGMSLDEEEDEEDAADFKRAVNDALEGWEWLDFVVKDNADDYDYIDYSTQKLASDPRSQLSINICFVC